MDCSGSRANRMNPEVVHVSFASDLMIAVRSSMNLRKNLLIAYIYIHLSLSLVKKYQGDHIYKQIVNSHCVSSISGTASMTSWCS